MSDLHLNKKLDEWHHASQQANQWAAAEKQLRTEIFASTFPEPKAGTNKIRIDHGMALIGDYRINYTIDRPGLEVSRSLIPANVFDEVISYRPEVKPGAYLKLELPMKKLFSPFITEKPGTPGLEIKPAANVRW